VIIQWVPNTRWIYFTLLQVQLIMNCIKAWCSTNYSPDYLGITVSFYVIIHCSELWFCCSTLHRLHTPWSMFHLSLQHWGDCLPELIFIVLVTPPMVTRCLQLFPSATRMNNWIWGISSETSKDSTVSRLAEKLPGGAHGTMTSLRGVAGQAVSVRISVTIFCLVYSQNITNYYTFFHITDVYFEK
jgi:hypothetical protein